MDEYEQFEEKCIECDLQAKIKRSDRDNCDPRQNQEVENN